MKTATETGIRRFLTYSLLIHAAFLAGAALQTISKSAGRTYYVVDFMAGGGGGGAGVQPGPARAAPEAAPKKAEPEKKPVAVNPKEDLLLKSKRKSKVKEVVSEVPSPPSLPIPQAPAFSGGAGSSADPVPMVPAGPGSGVGIGFGEGGGGAGGSGNFPYAWYVHTLKGKLDANWNVTEGYSRRIYAQVAFTIERSGNITDVKLEEPSPHGAFDEQALRAVQTASPLPPLPRDFPESSLRVHVRFTVKN